MGLSARCIGRGEYTYIDGLPEAAISWGWEAVEKDTFDVRLVDRMPLWLGAAWRVPSANGFR